MLTGVRPRGASLIELLLVLTILGVAAGAVTRVATHHQRSYARLALHTLAITQLRHGADVLSSSLEGLAPGAGDIYPDGLRHGSIDFRAPMANALLCTPAAPGSGDIDLVAAVAHDVDSGAGDEPPAAPSVSAGDSLLLYDAAADTAGAPAPWSAHAIVAAAPIRRACPPLDTVVRAAVRVAITPAVSRAEGHAPVRIFRRARYALYRAGDGNSYLGFRDCLALARDPACSPLQPVAGPFLDDAGSTASDRGGLALEYLDASGAAARDPLTVATITATLRAQVASPGTATDTVVVRRVIGLRNAPR